MTDILPETVLQFGAGNFLRAFADLFIHQANAEGQNVGRIVIVQSTDSGRAAALNSGGAAYHVLVRGMWNGAIVDDAIAVTSVSRAINARSQWDDVLQFAESPDLKLVVSNTTEAGMTLADADYAALTPPGSFPAKLVKVLQRRFERKLPGLTIMPCELVEANGRKLRDLCLEQAMRWELDRAFMDYLRTGNIWLNSLVDRIVSGKPAEHPLLASDPLLTAAEPFALWAVESPDPTVVPFRHPAAEDPHPQWRPHRAGLQGAADGNCHGARGDRASGSWALAPRTAVRRNRAGAGRACVGAKTIRRADAGTIRQSVLAAQAGGHCAEPRGEAEDAPGADSGGLPYEVREGAGEVECPFVVQEWVPTSGVPVADAATQG
jgi:hypothetical protein